MEETLTKPKKVHKVKVDKQILEEVQTETDVEKQVIVHCFFKTNSQDNLIRIWKSTYLRDQDSKHKSQILNAFNITFYPIWQPILNGRNAKFTLVFSALPKSCNAFDLFEDIPEGGGFFTGVISRNKSDVYSVEIFS